MKGARGLLLLCVLFPLLVACDPSGPSEAATADLAINITADGGARVEVRLPRDRSGLSLSALGDQLGADLFPRGPRPRTTIDSQGGSAYPLIRVQASSVYSPGLRPQVNLDLGDAVRTLHEQGFASVNASVIAPYVPSEAHWSVAPESSEAGYWGWRGLTGEQSLPAGQVRLKPEPLRAVGELALVLLAVACLVAGAQGTRSRHRWLCAASGVVAVVVAGVLVMTAGAVQGDNLGVAGYLAGRALTFITLVPLVGLIAIPLGLALIVLGFSYGRPKPQLVQPP